MSINTRESNESNFVNVCNLYVNDKLLFTVNAVARNVTKETIEAVMGPDFQKILNLKEVELRTPVGKPGEEEKFSL
jgi:sulfopyruvate decarboxylase TPP-binding subunit